MKVIYKMLGIVILAGVTVLLQYSSLKRSLWLDEAMLLANYPLDSYKDFFKPLKYYDQAAPPGYSFLESLLWPADIKNIRILHSFVISAILIYTLSWGKSFVWCVLAVICALAFKNQIIYMAELKQYGLELATSLIMITWYVYKSPYERLKISDIILLLAGVFVGISTIIASGISISLYLVRRILIFNKWFSKKELFIVLAYIIVGSFAVYLAMNNSRTQINNFPESYRDLGAWNNLNKLCESIFLAVGGEVFFSVGLALLILMFNIKNQVSKNLVAVSLAGIFAVIILNAVGIYPGRSERSINWMLSYPIAMLFYALYFSLRKIQMQNIYGFILFFIVSGAAYANTRDFILAPYKKSDDEIIVKYLVSLGSVNVALWNGAQPVVEAYSKLYPGLLDNKYYGLVNRESFLINFGFRNVFSSEYDLERRKPGAWARTSFFAAAEDYYQPAATMIHELANDTTFYLYASQYDPMAKGGFGEAMVRDLDSVLKFYGCTYAIEISVHYATLYKARCSGH